MKTQRSIWAAWRMLAIAAVASLPGAVSTEDWFVRSRKVSGTFENLPKRMEHLKALKLHVNAFGGSIRQSPNYDTMTLDFNGEWINESLKRLRIENIEKGIEIAVNSQKPYRFWWMDCKVFKREFHDKKFIILPPGSEPIFVAYQTGVTPPSSAFERKALGEAIPNFPRRPFQKGDTVSASLLVRVNRWIGKFQLGAIRLTKVWKSP